MMVRVRFASMMGVGLVSVTALAGCFGTGYDKGDGDGTGTGRPPKTAVDQGKTGGLGAPRTPGGHTIGPGDDGVMPTNAPDVGAH